MRRIDRSRARIATIADRTASFMFEGLPIFVRVSASPCKTYPGALASNQDDIKLAMSGSLKESLKRWAIQAHRWLADRLIRKGADDPPFMLSGKPLQRIHRATIAVR